MNEKKLKAIAAANAGWIPVTEALPETGVQVIVTTKAKRGTRNVNKAWVDDNGLWHGTGTFAEVVAWRKIDPWEG